MRTLREQQALNYQRQRERRQKHLKDCRAVLEEVRAKEISPHGDASPETIKALRRKLATGNVDLYPFVCDHCHTQVTNPYPGRMLTSIPPKYHAACPGCGWTGTVTA